MEEKIKVLEVNNIDLAGRRFNGYDLIEYSENTNVDISQSVVIKQSHNKKVNLILKNSEQMQMFEKLENFENDELSIHSNLSITSPALINSEEYKNADIIHFHMFHNTKLSLISLLQICTEKKVVMSIHDPWTITGRCVHFGECDKWKTGCNDCLDLNTLFEFKEDNCNSMWNLKKMVYSQINPEIIVSSQYMYRLIKQSPLTKHFTNVHIIPLGIDLKNFSNEISKEVARRKFNISNDDIVLFLRAQEEFKGTSYIVEALKMLKTDRKITILTCDEKGRLNEINGKYNIIDIGRMNNEELIYAYNACDIFLMPSLGETFGLMAVEAMACSRPVIIFDNTALPAVTHAPECGVLVENKNSNKLMEAIDKLIKNPEERKRRGELGRKICEEEYNIENYNNSLIDLYKKIPERKSQDTFLSKNINYYSNESMKIEYELNKFTKANFKEKSVEYKELIFKKDKYIDGKIDYSNKDVQRIINNYNNDLYNIMTNKRTNKLIVKIKNAVTLLFTDQDRLKNSIQYKFNQIFKKKD